MKRKVKLLILIPVLLLAVSCGKDFTTLGPKSNRDKNNFYQTETDFQQAIEGAYGALQSDDAYGRNYSLMLEMRADNTVNGGGSSGLAKVYYDISHFQELTTADILSSTWTGAYRGIARCNTIISKIGNLENQNLANRIEGEAIFIRSLFYYNLSVIFGNIPLQLKDVTNPDIKINQVSADVIYNQIAGDLEKAEDLLPASYTDAEDVGRVTSGAAATLLGLVQLTNGNNSAAEAALRKVVESNQYKLVSNYGDIWGIDHENNVESIFEIQYQAGGTGTGSSFTDFFTPFGQSGGVGGGNAPQDLTPGLTELFGEDDERGWGGTFDSTYVTSSDEYVYYVKKFESEPFGPFDADNNFIVFRYADVLLMLAEAIGESPESYKYINQVRNRAGIEDIDKTTPGTFREKLLHERRLEFMIEDKRWPDLLRFDKAKEVMGNFSPLVVDGINESDIRLLYPIPQREIDADPDEMKQNDNL